MHSYADRRMRLVDILDSCRQRQAGMPFMVSLMHSTRADVYSVRRSSKPTNPT